MNRPAKSATIIAFLCSLLIGKILGTRKNSEDKKKVSSTVLVFSQYKYELELKQGEIRASRRELEELFQATAKQCDLEFGEGSHHWARVFAANPNFGLHTGRIEQTGDEIFVALTLVDIFQVRSSAVKLLAGGGSRATGERVTVTLLNEALSGAKLIDECVVPVKGLTELHHLLPKSKTLKPFFERAGMNIEDFKIPLDVAKHRLKPDGIHTISGGNWNKVWKEYFDVTPNASNSQILEQLARMREQFGI